MAQDIFWPIANQKYPWLTKEESTKIDNYSNASGLTWMKLLQYQTNLYKEYINYKTQKERDEDRTQAKNQLTYASLKTEDKKQSNNYQNQERLEDLVDTVKNKYNLSSLMSSNDVMNWLVQKAHDDWVSIDLLNKYLNNWDRTFLYEMWLEEKPVAWTTVWDSIKQSAKNIWGWLLDSFSTDFMKAWANVTAWWMKKLWMDEEEVEQRRQNAINKIEWIMDVWQDKSSVGYNVTNIWGDLWQLISWWWIIKAGVKWTAKAIPLLEKVGKLAEAWGKLIEEFPILWKLTTTAAKKAPEWVFDTILYNAINWEWTSTKEMKEWGLINTVLWVAWKFVPSKKTLSDFAKRMEVWGLIDSPKLEAINNELNRYLGNTFQDVKAAGNWLLQRWFKGDKSEMIKSINEWKNKFLQAKEEMFKMSDNLYKSDRAEQVIRELLPKYEWVPWREAWAEWLKALQGKTEFTAKELDNIISLLDDSNLAMFDNKALQNDAIVWGGWATIRRELKEQVEDIMKQEWVGDIAAINSEIQVAKTLEKALAGKLTKEEASSLLPKGWASIIDKAANLAWFEWFSRNLANTLAKISWIDKTTIANKLKESWTFSEDFLKSIVPETKWWEFKEALSELIWKDLTTTTSKAKKTNKKTQLVPLDELNSDTLKWWGDTLSTLIRQFLLTQTEEQLND